MSAEDAARLIKSGMCIGASGFTLVGYPVLVPEKLAELGLAKELTLLTGASVGDELDGALCRAGLLKFRAPYQSDKALRSVINSGNIGYNDFHLSHMPMLLDRRTGPEIDFAIVECAAVLDEGILPGLSVGASDCFVRNAKNVILELNTRLPTELYGMHDICSAGAGRIDIESPGDRTGSPLIPCDLEKVRAVVINDREGNFPHFVEPDGISQAIAENIIGFLKAEVEAGRQPKELRPIQSGVGNVANAVRTGLGRGFSGLSMYTEVLQDGAFLLVEKGIIRQASTTALSLSRECFDTLCANVGYFRDRIVIRPQEISNHPEVIRRLQLISLNTPIEADIYGNVNSTHVMGSRIMNGIGGSGDFARNAGLTVFATGSLAKGGAVSCIVPMVSHVDHTEHDVDVIVTEIGVADLRWKTPRQRAEAIIENCAHPDYRPLLREYFDEACRTVGGQTPHILSKALSWHERCQRTGSMKP